MQERKRKRRLGIAIAIGLIGAALLAPAAAHADKYGYLPKEEFGSAAKPSFGEPIALAVDPATRDLLVVDSGAKTISRFKPNGEADNFSALGTNVIDGKSGPDETPQGGLSFVANLRSMQLAVAPASAGATAGDIYVTQESNHLIDVFSSAGAYLGQITQFSSDEIQKLELSGFAEGDEFSLANLPAACGGSSTDQIPYRLADLGPDTQAALEAQCGPDFAASATVAVDVEYTGALGDSDQPQPGCIALSGEGSCAVSTITPGDATHNELQRIEFNGFKAGDQFRLGWLGGAPATCQRNETSSLPYAAGLAQGILVGLEEPCGANFNATLAATASVAVEFANGLSAANQPQLSCTVGAGAGTCATSTSQEGGEAKSLGAGSTGVAVDSAGAVGVGDHADNLIHRYLPTSNSPFAAENVANFARYRAGELAAGTGPSAGSIFSVGGESGEAAKLDDETGAQQYVVDPKVSLLLAVDPADGSLLSASESEVRRYDASGPGEAKRLAHFIPGGGNLQGIAVDPTSGDLYVSRSGQAKIAVYEPVPLPEAVTEAAGEVLAQSATLHGKVSAAGGPPASCEFQYTTEAAFEKQGFKEAQTVQCAPEGPFTGSSSQAVAAHVEELAPGTAYRFRVVAKNQAGWTPDDAFFNGKPDGSEGALSLKTLGPAIAEEEIGEIGETTATISAQLNPNGEATTYAVQYVSEADYQSSGYSKASLYPLTPEDAGSGTQFLAVSIALPGLPPGAAFHARITAANPGFTVNGPDLRFSTYPLAGGLPDGRVWEKVTPSEKAGEVIPPESSLYLFPNLGNSSDCIECLPGTQGISKRVPMQTAPDGNSVIYEGQPFSGGLAAGFNQYVSRRSPGGWGWQSLSTPTTTGNWQAFSADLSRGVLWQEEPALSPEAPTREGRAFADLYLREAGGALTPLLTTAPPHRVGGSDPGNGFKIRLAAANAGTGSSPAFTHIAFEANDALTAAVPGVAPKAPEITSVEKNCTVSPCNLYEWAGGHLRLVNVLPGNAAAAGGSVIGSGRLLGHPGSQVEAPDISHAVSDDGRFVFFSSQQLAHVYARIDGERTLAVAGPGSCKESVALDERACFLTASADGHRVLLANGQLDQLNEAETAYAQADDLSEGQGGFQGILGASEDLARIYFVDTAALTPVGEANENGEHAEAGSLNLYAWHEGASAFVGALLPSDDEVGFQVVYGAWKASPSDRTAQVSPDGRYLAFMSQAPVTGYDNTCTTYSYNTKEHHVGPCAEVFEYAAATGGLTCASCNPDGRPPLGASTLSLIQQSILLFPAFPQPRNLVPGGEGRLFFESQDVLSTRDHDGSVIDVYEYEPPGVGSCETAGPDYSARDGGCISLISGGRGSGPSLFLDSTPSGSDAFFITRERLVPSDKDEQLDLYDARVGGGFEEGETTPCEGEACRGASPPSPAGVPSAASATFAGPGNPPQQAKKPGCGKGKVRRRGRCVAKRRDVAKKHKRHKRDHGGSR